MLCKPLVVAAITRCMRDVDSWCNVFPGEDFLGRDTQHFEETGRGYCLHAGGAAECSGKREEGRKASRGCSKGSTPSPKTTGDAPSTGSKLNRLACHCRGILVLTGVVMMANMRLIDHAHKVRN